MVTSCDSRASSSAEARVTLIGLGLAIILMAVTAAFVEQPVRMAAVASAAVIAGIFLAILTRRLAALGGGAARAAGLAAVLDAERGARLVTTADGREIHRNPTARDTLGPATDPLAPFAAQADERTLEVLTRLRDAAAHGIAQFAEISFTTAGGGREWWQLSVQPLTSPSGAMVWAAEDATGRRAIEETLRREHESLTDFLDFLPVGCYSADPDGRFRYVNLRLAEWLGCTPEALIGQDIREVFGVVPNPEEDRAEMRLRGKGGEVFQALVTHTVYDDAGETLTRSVVVRDPVPELLLEHELKTAERRLHWLFDIAPVAIALTDPDGSIHLSNRAFQEMLGLDDDASGQPLLSFIAEMDRERASDQLSRVLMGSSPGVRLDLRLRGRHELIASTWVSPTAEDGAVTGLMLHFIDTTDQKNLEIQLAQSQKMQAMGQLAGGIAHDFNNLLTAMIGFCDLLLQRHGPGDASFADIMQIKQNANRAASLVRQLLAFSRRQAMLPQPLSVTDALADLSTLLRRLLGERIELEIVHGRDVGMVRVDPGQFDQVVINLAVNARDAMPGGGTLAIHTDSRTITAPMHKDAETVPAGRYTVIEVSDTGTGITPEDRSRIFEPFFSTKAVGAGTGLGLSTVYGIIRQNEGFIFVDSTVGQGSTFTIYLQPFEPTTPLIAAPSPPAPAAHELIGAGAILLVEDEDAVRLFAARALRNKGYTVIEATNGEGALDVLKAGQHFDLLITDVVMPGMDGATLARLVRMERPGIRSILISGYSEDVAFDGLSDQSDVHFLPKPFSLKQLALTVKKVLAGGS